MLLDPFEEQLDLPAALVERADGERGQGCLVGEEDEGLAGLWIFEADAAQVPRVVLLALEAIEGDGLVAQDACRAIGGHRVQPPSIEIALGARDEEAPA